jgi:hypothetical protein
MLWETGLIDHYALGLKTIVMVLPSIFGCCSTVAYSIDFSATICSACLPRSVMVISRPRNITVTLTLFFFSMNFLRCPSLISRSWTSVLGRSLISFQLKGCLFFSGFLLFFILLVFVPAIIHDFTYRRFCAGRNLNQVKP